MIEVELLNGTSLSFIGDAVYSLYIRKHIVEKGIHLSKDLQKATVSYVSAKGQREAYSKLIEHNFLNDKELEVYKRGRNAIGHIPKNGNLNDYSIASGLEAIVGYLYLTDQERLEELFKIIYE